MNVLTLTQRRISAITFAGIAMASLLLTALPMAFYVAEANGDTQACTTQVEDNSDIGNVENTNTNQYFTTIQNAINDCDTEDGHTIEVADGATTAL